MATPKYKKQFDTMLATNNNLFSEYEKLQEMFDTNPESCRAELAELKLKLLRIIRRNEDMLCAKSENTKYGVYSENLAMKFWEEVRATYPKIDQIV